MLRNRLVYLVLTFILLTPMFLTPLARAYAQDWDDLSVDIDGDGLPNELERQGWHNTSGGPYLTDYLDADTDADGLTDGKEHLYGTNPLDDHSPGISVEYQAQFQTREYYAWWHFGEQYVALPSGLGSGAVVIRRGTTFFVGGPSGADLTVEKSISGLTTPTVERDPCAGRWNITLPSWGKVGTYTLKMKEGTWSKTLDLYVIFDLPTNMSEDFISAYIYTESPDNRLSDGTTRSNVSMVYAEGGGESAPLEYTHDDYSWIPEGEWVNHGWTYAFRNQQYDAWLFNTHIAPYINGYTDTWNAANALRDHIDDVTCLDWPRPLMNSWQVLHPLDYSPYTGLNQCSNMGAMLTAANRSAGIPARPVWTDWTHGSFDHATEVWTSDSTHSLNWYVMRGGSSEHGHCENTAEYDAGDLSRERLAKTKGFYYGQGVYAVGESWPWSEVGRFTISWDAFRQNSWDDTVIVKRDWWETRFKAYWGTSSEPTVIGTPPNDWPDDLPPAPVISFSGTPLVGIYPLTVAFNGTYSGDVNTRAWDFGDGGSSTSEDPTYTYDEVGDYTVSLTVQGAGGTTVEEKSNYIHVYNPVNAAFTANSTTGYASLTVNFTDQSTGNVASRSWNFGDGGSSSSQNPSHTYTAAGDYTVVLTVQGMGGDSDTETKTAYIHVYEPLQAAFTANPTSGPAPLTVEFTDQSTGDIVVWGWNFGDETGSTEQNPDHTFQDAGIYTVRLTVMDTHGGGDTESETITVNASSPSENVSEVAWKVNSSLTHASATQVGTKDADNALSGDSTSSRDDNSDPYGVYLPVMYKNSKVTLAEQAGSESEVQLGSVLADYGRDLDGDGRYDQLVFEVEVNVAQAGDYWVRGILSDFASTVGEVSLEAGHQIIYLHFDGMDIYMNKVDGPYVLQGLWITDAEDPTIADLTDDALDYAKPDYQTLLYDFSDFGITGARLSGKYIHHNVDTDGDKYDDALIWETGLEIEKAGIYTVKGVLHDAQDNMISEATWSNSDSASANANVSLQFDGLRDSVGPYTLYVHVRNAEGQVTDGVKDPYVIDAIPAFSARPIELGVETVQWVSLPGEIQPSFVITEDGYTDAGLDTDGDGKFDQLVITVDVEVEPGEGGEAYRIEGWLIDRYDKLITWDISAPEVLTVGVQSLSLAFDGRIINEHGVDGPYRLVALKALPGDIYDVLDEVDVAYTTSTYYNDAFEAVPSAPAKTLFADDMESEAALIAIETFEEAALNEDWTEWSSTEEGRIQIAGDYGVAMGTRALLMDDDTADGSTTLNEAIWTVDLSGVTKPNLTFWYAEWTDESHVFSGDFSGHYNADGIAISDDGINWHPIFNSPNQTAGVWQQYSIDLAAEAAGAGITFGPDFKIKFQQYDNSSLTGDGCGWDEIVLIQDNPKEQFEAGTLGTDWTVSSSPSDEGRIRVTDDYGTAEGSYALVMDDSTDNLTYTLNEAIWTVDLSDMNSVILTFSHAEWNDETHSFAGDFSGSYNADGIAISDDGANWHPIFDAPNQTDGVWQEYIIDLTAEASAAGMMLGTDFKIKFQQYDNYSLTGDGRGWDEIFISGSRWINDPVWNLQGNRWHSYSHAWAAEAFEQSGSLSVGAQDMAQYVDPTLVFKTCYNMQSGANVGHVEVSSDGIDWSEVATYTNATSHWNTTQVDLGALGEVSEAQFRFRIDASDTISEATWVVDDVWVTGWPAVISATFDYADKPVMWSEVITFAGSYTSVNTTLPVTYTWDFDDGSIVVTNEPTTTHQFTNPVRHTVWLTVENPYDNAGFSLPIEVRQAVTETAFTFGPGNLANDWEVSFAGTYLPVSASIPMTYNWDFGDGDSIITTSATLTHVFPLDIDGTYTVVLTTTNGYGDAVSASHIVTVPLDEDGDGILNSIEVGDDPSDPVDTDTDGTPDYLDDDSDDDGIPDAVEAGDTPRDPVDTDEDTIPDYRDADDDGDGVDTADEDVNGNGDPTDDDTDGDITPDYLDEDDDGDSINTLDEDADGDGDPTDDDADEDGVPNYLDDDSDDDGIPDEEEGTDDVDEDGVPNYLDDDSDDDGIPDSTEGTGDPDEDDIPNYLDDDSDDDGIPDSTEGTGDSDEDDSPNYLDDDSDDDGIPDSVEGTGNPDGDEFPNYLDEDSDGDGKLDVDEGTGDIDNDEIPNWLDDDENYPPVAVDDEVATDEDIPVVIDVTANDQDLDRDVLTVSGVGMAAHGTLIYAGDTVTYTPGANYFGSDTFTYLVGDGMFTDTARVTVTIAAVNDAPVAMDDNYSVDEGGALDEVVPGVLGNDVDVENDTLLVVSGESVSHGSLTFNADGSFSYIHDGGETTADSFTYQTYDGALYSDRVTVTLHITPVNDAPVLAAIDDQSVDEGMVLSFAATATDVDLPANTLTFSLGVTPVGNGVPAGADITPDGVFSWTPDEAQGPGVYPITVRVSDGVLEDMETFTVTVSEVNSAPVLDTMSTQSVNESSVLSFTVTAMDVDLPANMLTFSLEPGAPAGASITPDGMFNWMPDEVQGPGVYPITVGVTDGALRDSGVFTVTVGEVNTAPVLASIGDRAAVVDMPLRFATVATDADVPANELTFSLETGAPAGASITPAGGFSWTPAVSGTYTVTVRVSDDGVPALNDTETFQIMVTMEEINWPPELDIVAQTVDEGSLLSARVIATDPNAGDVLTFSLESGVPAGASITPDGVFNWTPDEVQGPGVYPITVVVTDGDLSDSGILTVTVNEVNVAPVLAPVGDKAAVVDTPLSFAVVATDADIPANALAFSLDADAPAGAGIASDGIFSWIPAAVGTYTVTVRVNDDGVPVLNATSTFHIVVTTEEVNWPPVLDALVSQTVDEGDTLSFRVTATDLNDGDVLAFSLESGAPAGAGITPGGVFSWTPDEAQGPGVYPITVGVTDGDLSDSGTFTVTVNEVNAAPVAIGDSYRVNEGDSLDIPAPGVLDNDTDAEDGLLRALLVTGVSYGNLTLNEDGSFHYTHDGSKTTLDSFIYKVNDGELDSASVTVTLSITPTNIAPVFTSVAITAATEDVVYTYTLAAMDADVGDTLTFSGVMLPGWLTLTDNGDGTATLSGTPANDEVGVHSVSIQVKDTAGAIATQNFAITVANVNDAPTFTSIPKNTVRVDEVYTYTVTTEDVDVGDSRTIALVTTLPNWLTFVDNGDGTAVLSGTPQVVHMGEQYQIKLIVEDLAGATHTQEFTLTVRVNVVEGYVIFLPVLSRSTN
ncbi:MAG: tandem-95 repeat protein [Anaerolineae bacterium]|nr:tandem-95 repeat protein [Anaerolineae bacterium]